MNKPVLQLVDELSRETCNNIDLAFRLNTKFGEETITDLLLLELAKKRNYNLRIIQTPKDKEKDKGTDWEWFIGSPTYGWVRFAIQAKKIKLSTKNGDYGLGHKVGLNRQVDILQTYASANNAIPLYTFYNYYDSIDPSNHWHCNLPFDEPLLGWTITPISNVFPALLTHGTRNFEHIHRQKNTLPIKCLFQCPILTEQYRDVDLIGKAVNILGETAIKYKNIPYTLTEQLDRPESDTSGIYYVNEFSREFYNADIQTYPKRIAIFQIE